VTAAAVAGWRALVTPWHRNWGASDQEVAMALPGDELTPPPVEQNTRAITIAAPPDEVWPWLVQMGADRGGFYSYTWLENPFGLQIRNADRIVPEWQELTVGDWVWGSRDRSGGWRVELVEPDRALVLKVADPKTGRLGDREVGVGFEFQWTFALLPTESGGTRLLIRERSASGRSLTRWLMAPVGFVSFVMTRKMLDGIRVRAESARRSEGDAAGETTVPPTLPPAWFKHLFWRGHRALYRLLGDRVLWTPASKRGWGALHLTTIGRRSGEPRGVILGYVEDGPCPVVLAMNGWDEGHPAWWLNLVAEPDAVMSVKGEPERVVRARKVAGEERERLWRRWAEIDGGLDAFAASRSVETPMVIFEPCPDERSMSSEPDPR
jgi:deazaflavin-dependent oxidoreductase (nitroreductase family)